MALDCNMKRSLESLQKEYYCNAIAGFATPAIDYEFVKVTVCDLNTNTWHYVTTPYVNGVQGADVSIDSGIPCDEPLPIEPKVESIEVCDALTGTIHAIVNQYAYPDPTDLTNVVTTQLSDTDTGIKCNEEEIDLVRTNWLPICVDGVEWYVGERSEYNNSTDTETLEKVYKQGANGAIVLTAPTGTVITEGYCELSFLESANGVDIPENSAPFNIPVPFVKTFTVTREGLDDVIINTPSGTVTMHLQGSRTFGSGSNSKIDTSGFSIVTGADSKADIIWEI